ncbi:hypothetical protein L596_015983 [Steinernema carpocapsae]|uniref:Piwi domain-containing protein n=1 Tax=Steinernema carpocapsae TaxID=34508 RepID=A0A4U5NGR6_STECR|nr:hypothetical protein L596_015983 [Steinernema carpocapsae]
MQHSLFKNYESVVMNPLIQVAADYEARGIPEVEASTLVKDGSRIFPAIRTKLMNMEGPQALTMEGLHEADHACLCFRWEPFAVHSSLLPLRAGCPQQGALWHPSLHRAQRHEEVLHRGSRQRADRVEVDGQTLKDFLKTEYEVTLKKPDLFLIVEKRGSLDIYHAMELCTVAPFQRPHKKLNVPPRFKWDCHQMKNKASPSKHTDHAKRLRESVGLVNENVFLQGSGVTLATEPMEVTARILESPMLRVKREGLFAVKSKGEWRYPPTTHFVHSAKIERWGVCLIFQERMWCSDRYQAHIRLNNLMKVISDRAGGHGMRMAERFQEPYNVPIREGSSLSDQIEQVRLCFERCKETFDPQFLFFVIQEGIHGLRDCIEAFERKYQIAALDVNNNEALKMALAHCSSRQKSPMAQVLTSTNIEAEKALRTLMAKINTKMGGLNFEVESPAPARWLPLHRFTRRSRGTSNRGLRSSDTLRISAILFSGDARVRKFDESLPEFLAKIVKRCCIQFNKVRGVDPQHVIIYQSQPSKDLCQLIVDRTAILLGEIGISTELTYVFVDEHHDIRLTNTHLNNTSVIEEQNLLPGTVIDTHLVRKGASEFFLNSHIGLVGLSEVPKYTAHDFRSGLDGDNLQSLTYTLCYAVQSLNAPVSVPAPLYVAKNKARHGASCLKLTGKVGARDFVN